MLNTLLINVGAFFEYLAISMGIGMALLLYAPIFYLSRKGTSPTAQFVALLLSFALIFLDNWAFGPIMVLNPLKLLFVRLLISYVPVLVVFYKLVQTRKLVKE
jgi:hypothetical protein